MNTWDCKVCQNPIIENEAGGKKFWYCRTCKDERTVFGNKLPKLEDKPQDAPKADYSVNWHSQSKRKQQGTDLYGTYGGGFNQRPPDAYLDPSKPQTLTQDEIDELFADFHNQGAD